MVDETQVGEETPAQAESSESPAKYDLGVVFVHGIGSQVQGGTLLQFGEPLYRWFFRWLGDGTDPGGDDANRAVQMTSMQLQPDSGSDPAHCDVEINVDLPPQMGGATHQQWVFAESWWAEVFSPPPFTKLGFWLLTSVPWIALEFMFRVVKRAIRQPGAGSTLALLSVPFVLLIGPIIGTLVALLVTFLLLLNLIPFGPTRSLVQKVAIGLATGIGDAFILIQSPMKHAAMIERIERDLAWVAKKSDRVAIVAHSQGAALVHEVLATTDQPRVKLFVTVGSAVRRLAEFRQLRLKGAKWQIAGWLSLLAGGYIAIGVGALIVLILGGTVKNWPEGLRGGWYFLGLAVALGLLGVAYYRIWTTFTTQRSDLRLPDTGTGLKWVDCYASADPVPNGPLFEWIEPPALPSGLPPAPYEPVEIYNRRWMLNDHVTYPGNLDQFLSKVARAIAELVGLPILIGPLDAQSLDRATMRRQIRTSWLNIFRTVFILAAAFMVGEVAHTGPHSPHENLQDIANAVQRAVPGWLWTALKAAVKPVQGAVKGLGLSQVELIAVLVLVVLLAVAYALIGAGWSSWDRADIGRLFYRSTRKVTVPATIFVVAALIAVGGCVAIGVRYI